MARKFLSQMDDWELIEEDQDVRGRMLLDHLGNPLGVIADMIVDTRTEQVDAVVLENGAEYPARDLRLFDGEPVLLRDARSASGGRAERPREGTGRAAAGPSGADRAGDRLALREEELHVRKESVEAGQVAVEKVVVAERKVIKVPVRREEVVLERRRVQPRPADRPVGDLQRIRFQLRREEVTVEKVPVVVEEVTIGKRAPRQTERISETIRREELAIETRGRLNVDEDVTTAHR